MFWSNWFVFKYIYSGTRNLAVLQCFDKSGLVDDSATSCIHKNSVWF